MMAHVTSETRRVYRSARGCKLTKHAAYVAAAKHLIAERCNLLERRETQRLEAEGDPLGWAMCARKGEDGWRCRFHETYSRFVQNGDEVEPREDHDGMVYYGRVLPRLVRFLKFIDKREQQAADAAKGG